MKRDNKLFLEDILENIDLIEKDTSKTKKEEFVKNRMLQNATIRGLEIIGEASKNIPQNIKEKYPKIKWKKIIGMRDIIVHAYFDIDLDIVWDIIKKELPDLKEKILKIRKVLKDKKCQ